MPNFKKNPNPIMKKGPFQLRSGNTTPFYAMGSTPADSPLHNPVGRFITNWAAKKIIKPVSKWVSKKYDDIFQPGLNTPKHTQYDDYINFKHGGEAKFFKTFWGKDAAGNPKIFMDHTAKSNVVGGKASTAAQRILNKLNKKVK